MYVREIRVSYGMGVEIPALETMPVIEKAHQVAALMAPLLEPETVEVSYLLCLSTKMKLLGYHEISRGSLNHTLMHPREVYKAAILVNAAAIVLVHNHPSGDPSPSVDDLAITGRLQNAGEVIGIELLDHVIVGRDGRFVSFKEQGRL